MTKIKICGITKDDEVDYVNQAKVDYVGFVFADSKRKITYEKAKELKQNLSDNIQTVGVFVNEDIKNIIYLCENNIIDMIQLHGDEDVEYIKRLKKHTDVKIIKVFKIKEDFDGKQFDTNNLEEYENLVDYFLFDTYSSKCAGGSGRRFDIDNLILDQINKPFFIAGGLCIDNITNVLGVKPYAVDISSGVEKDGKKDKNKVLEITKIIRKMSF